MHFDNNSSVAQQHRTEGHCLVKVEQLLAIARAMGFFVLFLFLNRVLSLNYGRYRFFHLSALLFCPHPPTSK